jgi:hypothetical protein
MFVFLGLGVYESVVECLPSILKPLFHPQP